MNKEAFIRGFLEKQSDMLGWLKQLGNNPMSGVLKTIFTKPTPTGAFSKVPPMDKLKNMFNISPQIKPKPQAQLQITR
jgi:hypothetical protein